VEGEEPQADYHGGEYSDAHPSADHNCRLEGWAAYDRQRCSAAVPGRRALAGGPVVVHPPVPDG
jgi:hypothetical protein